MLCLASPVNDRDAPFRGTFGELQLFYRNNIYTIPALHTHVTSLAKKRSLNPSGAIA